MKNTYYIKSSLVTTVPTPTDVRRIIILYVMRRTILTATYRDEFVITAIFSSKSLSNSISFRCRIIFHVCEVAE